MLLLVIDQGSGSLLTIGWRNFQIVRHDICSLINATLALLTARNIIFFIHKIEEAFEKFKKLPLPIFMPRYINFCVG
jgi:hypothetical protein